MKNIYSKCLTPAGCGQRYVRRDLDIRPNKRLRLVQRGAKLRRAPRGQEAKAVRGAGAAVAAVCAERRPSRLRPSRT